MTTTTPPRTGRLSLAASAVWRLRTAEPDPMGDPSGDAGDAISAYEYGCAVRAVERAGWATPGLYNEALRASLGTDGKHMSYGAYALLSVLEVEACPGCGRAVETRSFWTKQYGGGYNTTVRCTGDCGWGEVYV